MPNGNSYMFLEKKALVWNACKVTKKEYKIKINIRDFSDILAGEDVDKVVPEMSVYNRVFLKTGFTPREQTHNFNKPNIDWKEKPVDERQYNLLDIAIRSVIDASEYMMSVYNESEDIGVKYKDENQPLTKADIGSHNHLMGYLKAHTPFFVLSEECGEKYHKMITDHESFWLIDPLDGTKEFIKKNGEFGILISFIHKGESIVGVMYFPATDELYYACKDGGAYKVDEYIQTIRHQGFNHAIANRKLLNMELNVTKDLTLLTSRSHKTIKLTGYMTGLRNEGYTVKEDGFGAAVKFAKMLENKADIYARNCEGGGPNQWDMAAAHCIIKAAGGTVCNLFTRRELTYGMADMKLPSFIIKHPKLNV